MPGATASLREAAGAVGLRAASLAPDLDYNLDAAVECGDITCDERAFVDLRDPTFAEWFGANLDDGDLFAPEVRRRYATWRATAPAHDMLGFDWAGLGGLAIPFDDAWRGAAREAGEAAAAAGGTEAVCEAAVAAAATGAAAEGFMAVAAPLVARVAGDVTAHGTEALMASRRVVRDAYDAMAAARRARAGVVRDATPAPRRRVERWRRRVLGRSMSLLHSVAGRERARAWLSGDTVTVTGRLFDFRVRVRDLRSSSHGAMEVSVTDKDSVLLAELCVYAPDTPALDQVASLVLHVASGEEAAILATANVTRHTEAGLAHAGLHIARPSAARDGATRWTPARTEADRLSDALRGRVRVALGRRVAEALDQAAPALAASGWATGMVGLAPPA